MWIYTEHGFFNVMKDGEAEGQMKVRARRREHIERFIELIDTAGGRDHRDPR